MKTPLGAARSSEPVVVPPPPQMVDGLHYSFADLDCSADSMQTITQYMWLYHALMCGRLLGAPGLAPKSWRNTSLDKQGLFKFSEIKEVRPTLVYRILFPDYCLGLGGYEHVISALRHVQYSSLLPSDKGQL